jgi:hypothetical protein
MKPKIHIASCSFGKDEIWKDIEEHPGYQASSLGRVRSQERIVHTLRYGKPFTYRQKAKVLSLYKNKSGYLIVSIGKRKERKTYIVSRLIARLFIPNPQNLPEVNHKNEDKLDNRVCNLEWCNREYNQSYGTRNVRISKTMLNRDVYKHIMQYDMNMTFISEHISISAAERTLRGIKGKCGENIRQNLLGNTKHAYGYIWKYKET